MAGVTLSGVHKRYPDGLHAVRGVDLAVADGEFVVLVGPSGCGKTTTLRMIAGLEEVTDGEIRIGERVVNRVPPGDRDVAMVFQNYALYPHMSVRRNMDFGLRMRRTPRVERDRLVAEVAAMLGIADILDRKPGELSGGQRQRVALGRAIVRQPAVFLFDEPLSNLDAKLRGETRAELADLHRRLGATMVYVTHDQVEAMTLGQRLVLMDRGLVRQVGPPLEVYQRPASRFVATFVGSPAMNLVDGMVRGGRFSAPGVAGWDVAGLADGPATLGARPEAVRIARDGEGTLADAALLRVEPLGHESLAHYRLGETGPTWVVRCPPGELPPAAARLAVAPDAVHYFAADEAGERLAGGRRSAEAYQG